MLRAILHRGCRDKPGMTTKPSCSTVDGRAGHGTIRATNSHAYAGDSPPNAIGEPVLPPTPLSPDFDPLITSCDLTALSGFGGSLRPCCPKTAPGFALCSVRIVLRRSSLCTVPVELSEDTSPFADRSTPRTRKSLESRACFVRIVLRRSSLGAVPAEPPEGISSIAVCSTRLARKLPWYRAVPPGLIRRPT